MLPAELLQRWKQMEALDGLGDTNAAAFARLKDQWFGDAFACMLNLREDVHCWCGQKSVVWQLLEPFRSYFKDSAKDTLHALWIRMSGELQRCFKCVVEYSKAKEFYKTEYPDKLIRPLLEVLEVLDRKRLVSCMQRSLQRLQPVTEEEMYVLLEVLLSPSLLEDAYCYKIYMLFLRYSANLGALDCSCPQKYPRLYEFLFESDEGASTARKLGDLKSTFRGNEKLVPIQTILQHHMTFKSVDCFVQLSDTEDSGVSIEEVECPVTTVETIDLISDDEEVNEAEAFADEAMHDSEAGIGMLPLQADGILSESVEACHKSGYKRPACFKEPSRPSKRPVYAQELVQLQTDKQLEDWYKQILALDIFNIEAEPAETLQEVPMKFESHDHYLKVFVPLMFEEFKSQLRRSIEELIGTETRTGTIKSTNLQQRNQFQIGAFFDERGATRALSENDLVLLSVNPLETAPQDAYAIGKVERRKKGILMVKFNFEVSNARLENMKNALYRDSKWHVKKLMSITPHLREQQAIFAMQSFPLLNTILSPVYSLTNNDGSSGLSEAFWRKLRMNHNESQLGAVEAAISNSSEGHQFSLVQGPPGTGKTRTILAIISALFESVKMQNRDEKEQKVQEDADPLNKAWCTALEQPQVAKARVLVCAQSNAAVDELVARILKQGLYNLEGNFYKPFIVRVGDTKRMHPDSNVVHIDRLVNEKFGSEAITGETQSNSAELRSKLEEIIQEMQALVAPCLRVGQNQSEVENKKEKLSQLQAQQKDLFSELMKSEDREEQFFACNPRRKWQIKDEVLRNSEVVLTTLSGCGGHIYSAWIEAITRKDSRIGDFLYDAVIIDEAAQAVEPSTLIPLQLLKHGGKCVLVGDPKQLPPTVLSLSACKMSFEWSMFERFQRNGYPVTVLDTQYRMHPEIRSFPSLHFYDNRLLDGSSVSNGNRSASFHQERVFGPYMFFDVPQGQERSGQSLSNPDEVEVALEILGNLKARYPAEVNQASIALITPYQEQRKALRERFSKLDKSFSRHLDISTVDSFQGREVDIAVLSTVRASPSTFQAGSSSNIGFVADVRRMNVSLTRAKYSLWIIGNARTLEKNPDWAALLQDARGRGLFTTLRRPYHKIFSGRHHS